MVAVVDTIHQMVGHMVTVDPNDDTPQKRVEQFFITMDTVSLIYFSDTVLIYLYQ